MGFVSYYKSLWPQKRYFALPHNTIDHLHEGMIATSSSRTSSRKAQYWFPVLILALTCLATGFLAGEFIQDHNLLARLNLDALATSQCTAPSFRREWRSLSSEEKIAYTDGVKCMLSRGSKHEQNASAGIYHDFTRIHATHAKAGQWSLLRASDC